MSAPVSEFLSLRRRNGWESADSGILLWRDCFLFFLLFSGLPFIVMAFGLRLGFSAVKPWPYLILWWLKPLFDRPVLHIISVRFFSPQVSLGQFAKGLLGHIFRALPGDLLWRRFSLWRSGRMPLRVLERLRRRAVKQRVRTLENGGLGFSAGLTVFCMTLELCLLAGEAIFAYMMLEILRPGLFDLSWEPFLEAAELCVYILYCFNYIIVEAFYVCMGFGIYINSRIETEGWDIELLFRKFTYHGRGAHADTAEGGGRKQARSGNGVSLKPLVLAFLFLGFGLFFPLKGTADPAAPDSAYVHTVPAEKGEEVPLSLLDEVLSSPDFGGRKDGWGIRLKPDFDDEDDPDFPDMLPWMERFKEITALVLRALLIAGIAVSIIFLLYRYRKLPVFRAKKRAKKALPGIRSGPDSESPGSLLERAAALYERGRARDAWALCFSAAVRVYEQREGIVFPENATEYECSAIVRGAGGHNAGEFGTFVLAWVYFAYGGRAPEAGRFEDFCRFCRALLSLPEKTEAAGA